MNRSTAHASRFALVASTAVFAALLFGCGGGSSSSTQSAPPVTPPPVTPPQGPAGTVDTSFGTGGTVVTPFGTNVTVNAVVLQADGKIVVAGSTGNVSAKQSTFALVRYNSDGSLDAGFGAGGKVVVPSFAWAEARGVAIQSDGRIVVVGQSGGAPNSSDTACALVRFNPDGSPDATFGADGVILSKSANGIVTTCAGPALLAGGKIVVGVGERSNEATGTGGFGAFGAMQFNPDGTRDGTFGVGGEVAAATTRCCANAYSVVVQTDGKIVVGGGEGDLPNSLPLSDGQNILARFTGGGAIDPAYGIGGVVVEGASSFVPGLSALSLLPDGSVVAVAILRSVSHFLLNGASDVQFGNAGQIDIAGIGSGLQTNGKIIVAGYGGSDTRFSSGFAVWRLSSNGTLDSTFGSGGSVITPIGTGAADAHAVAILPDGRFIVAGSASATFTGGSDSNFAVVRYFGDPVTTAAR